MHAFRVDLMLDRMFMQVHRSSVRGTPAERTRGERMTRLDRTRERPSPPCTRFRTLTPLARTQESSVTETAEPTRTSASRRTKPTRPAPGATGPLPTLRILETRVLRGPNY